VILTFRVDLGEATLRMHTTIQDHLVILSPPIQPMSRGTCRHALWRGSSGCRVGCPPGAPCCCPCRQGGLPQNSSSPQHGCCGSYCPAGTPRQRCSGMAPASNRLSGLRCPWNAWNKLPPPPVQQRKQNHIRQASPRSACKLVILNVDRQFLPWLRPCRSGQSQAWCGESGCLFVSSCREHIAGEQMQICSEFLPQNLFAFHNATGPCAGYRRMKFAFEVQMQGFQR